jgi:hypothetical protein
MFATAIANHSLRQSKVLADEINDGQWSLIRQPLTIVYLFSQTFWLKSATTIV